MTENVLETNNTVMLYDKNLEQNIFANLLIGRVLDCVSCHDVGIRYLISLMKNEDFYYPEHVTIFQTIKWLIDQKIPLTADNVLQLVSKLRPVHTERVRDTLISIRNRDVKEEQLCKDMISLILKAKARKITSICNTAIQMCYTENADPQAIIAYIKKNI